MARWEGMNDIKQILSMRFSIGVCETLTDEEVEIIWDMMDRQIPKKPERIMEKSLIGENFWWYCGHCGASRHTGSKSNYCSHCGGKVDWTK